MSTSAATKRKIVIDEFQNFDYPNLALGQEIAKIQGSPGNYLFEVITAGSIQGQDLEQDQGKGDNNESLRPTVLASMPTKFRKTVYLIRGNYVYIEPINDGNKVKYEIIRILAKDHIKRLYQENLWPQEFSSAIDPKSIKQSSYDNALTAVDIGDQSESDESEYDEYVDQIMGGNPNNRRVYVEKQEDSSEEYEDSSEEEDSSDDEEDDDDRDKENDETELVDKIEEFEIDRRKRLLSR